MAISSNNNFSGKTINIILMYLSAASTAQNIKKLQQIQSYEEASFTSPKWPTFLKQKFFRKTITKILMQLLVSLIEHCKKIFRADPEFWGCKKFTWNSWQLAHLCKIYKKLLEQIQSYEDVSFLDPEFISGLPIWHKGGCFGIFNFCDFCRLIEPSIVKSLKIILPADSKI